MAQENLMPSHANQLPARFPVGTKLVIESRPARNGGPAIYARHVELPDGRSFSLPSRVARKSMGAERARLRRRSK
jgi:hypothetical protein